MMTVIKPITEEIIKERVFTMKSLKMGLLRIVSVLILASLIFCLAACGNKNNGGNGGGNTPPSADSIVDDLPLDADGNFDVTLLDNVQINLWSVIGLPDMEVLNDLIKEFNKQYAGMIEVKKTDVGHYDYYNALDSTYANDYANFPEVCLMHNEKNIEYALKGYFYPVDELITKTGVELDFDNAYDNIEKTTMHDGKHYGIPIDAHGYLTQIRQDIIKKNGLGFEGNTRFYPQSYEEYVTLLNGLKALADSGDLWVRNIALGQDHSWYQLKNGNPNLADTAEVTTDTFHPSFHHSEESDHLTALYVNGGTLLDADGKVVFHNNAGFEKYITDKVERFNSGLYGDGNKEADFPAGRFVMFSEGPWQSANTYDILYNNSELTKAGKLGVTEEDANDPIYSKPYTVARPYYMASEGAPDETASKWYGNGHVVTLTKKITSLQKAAAALIFTEWLTQGQNADGEYNLNTWCQAGHLPAWQNVYESDSYQAVAAKNMTLTAMGDPADVIALESTPYASVLINGLTTAVTSVQAEYLSTDGCDVARAKQILQEIGQSTQGALDLLKMGVK